MDEQQKQKAQLARVKRWREKNKQHISSYLKRRFESDPRRAFVDRLYKNTLARSRRKNFEFTLTHAWITEKICGQCELTKLPFELKSKSVFAPSIDRIDSQCGYTPDNCRLVLWFVNQAKSNMPDDKFLAVLATVANACATK